MPCCTVIPELPYDNIGEAIDWLCNAFGFTLRLRIADHRAQLNVGGGAVVLIERSPHDGQTSVMVRVDDIDQHFTRAKQNGAHIVREPASYQYGERQYSARDLGSHLWTFSQSVADIDPREWGGTLGQL